MNLQAVNPPGPGIPGLSQAMIVEGGRLMLLSGHVPMKADGAMAGPGLEAQLQQTFENLAATLAAAGATFANVARLTIYVRDFSSDQLPTIRAVRDRFLDPGRPAPASALIGVAALFLPDVLVEVDAIAALPER